MLMNNRKCILVMTDWYEPGFKAGGPIRSCVNFAHYLKNDYEIRIFTSDRDLREDKPYTGIETDTWINRNGVFVFYASPEGLGWKEILQQIKALRPDFIYLNSMFSPRFTVYPLLMKRLGKIQASIVLAPRGMLKKSALRFSALKKKIFLSLFRLAAIPGRVHFHATDEREETDIKENMGSGVAITRIGNFPGMQKDFKPPEKKEAGALSLIFVGRIHPIKNLDFLLNSLQSISANIRFTIVAPIEDEQYWQTCKELINKLPSCITTEIKHNVPHDGMEDVLLQQHVFALPTRGENFGHAIFESLAAGRPVLISDQTPWKGLAADFAGWDLALDNPGDFTAVIEKAAAMPQEEFVAWCKGAWQYCHDFICTTDIKQQYIKLFN